MEEPYKTIGKYIVLGTLGRGGMGQVFLAEDPLLGRKVAIKTLTSTLYDAESRGQFSDEARAVGMLAHANIVVVHEFGFQGLFPYIVMEYLSGRDLLEILAQKEELSLEQLLDIFLQILRGLDHAHSKGIVHRDIKPGNIRLTDDAVVKIMDFGIAKFVRKEATRSGYLWGTVHYMAPETILGAGVDGRVDVFSTGVMLYEFLTKEKPFQGESPTEVMKKIISPVSVSPDLLERKYPRGLTDIVLKALEKDPGKRYRSAGEMGCDLLDFQSLLCSRREAPRERPRTAVEYFEEGKNHYKQEEYYRAVQCFEKVLALCPGHGPAEKNLAIARSAHQEKQAEDLLRMGRLLFRNEEYKLAANVLEERSRMHPEDRETRILLEWSYREMKKQEERRTMLEDLENSERLFQEQFRDFLGKREGAPPKVGGMPPDDDTDRYNLPTRELASVRNVRQPVEAEAEEKEGEKEEVIAGGKEDGRDDPTVEGVWERGGPAGKGLRFRVPAEAEKKHREAGGSGKPAEGDEAGAEDSKAGGAASPDAEPTVRLPRSPLPQADEAPGGGMGSEDPTGEVVQPPPGTPDKK
jgi:tetratricopeptide (TPR) repeat protein